MTVETNNPRFFDGKKSFYQVGFHRRGDMHIIVDGYNLIRLTELREYERASLEEGRKALTRLLAEYRKNRGHSVTVVFDGWIDGSFNEERDRMQGVEIIYSRRGEKADEVIKRLIEKAGEEITVVTSDREISTYAAHQGRSAVASPIFFALMKSKLSAVPEAKEDRYRDEEDNGQGKAKKKGPSRKLSKKKRLTLASLKKL
jgi:predicted RNA-binding protein with PIN domain